MIIAFWLIGILPAMLLLGWLDSQCCKDDPTASLGNSFGVAVVFWPLTFVVFLFTVALVYFGDFEDMVNLQSRKDKDAK